MARAGGFRSSPLRARLVDNPARSRARVELLEDTPDDQRPSHEFRDVVDRSVRLVRWRSRWQSADGADSPPRLFHRLEELIERFGHEQHILKVIDLERLVEDRIE